ncbi:Alpha/beta hydrolase [Enterobacter asburiae]|uniref:alpha/beta hydrolase n=1 Tax=Enterobacter asburiae TaxID=61645 RepID=UPI002006BA19|nr:alpha/beta hydrolase [Enterobacter asburiae]MCK6786274.1 alpha/beta hydrolase [Enterobacter roggenkampii]MCM7834188.1 alpha/beta hydrolase [Enterobacter asburiae]
MPSYVMSVRKASRGKFTADIGGTSYLVVPDGEDPSPDHAIPEQKWFDQVTQGAQWKNEKGEKRGDLLFSVHGYNMSESEVIERHRLLANGLSDIGFKGIVVSFDWPSDDKALAYLPDRHKAKLTAMRLMTEGISYVSEKQKPDCPINIHVLGHSTGAYVLTEAFDDADDTNLPNSAWKVSQIIFVAGDVSSSVMSNPDPRSDSIYRHGIRLTNYSSRRDQALDISNVKRVGVAPRVGRVGLPENAPSNAINVDCTQYYEKLINDSAILTQDEPDGIKGMPSHSWYFGNKIFTRDLFCTLIGIDRYVIPTRSVDGEGKTVLIR